jgi:peptidoglycan-N-acetylglucosamine deacetylase
MMEHLHKSNTPTCAMTVDVEEYFQVAAFLDQIKVDSWEGYESRVVAVTRRILAMFARHDVKATFFTLGWVAKRHPDLIKEIVAHGHELASHGFYHQKVTEQSYGDFKQDLKSAKALLEDISGQQILGYRAPSFSICEKNPWAFDALMETGHIYSSSTYPVNHDHYGAPTWPCTPHMTKQGILELPQATADVLGRRLPVGGGGYFRLMPYWLGKKLINRFHEQHDHPYIFYFHPWEIDPEQPRIEGANLKSRFRHYVNLSRMEGKIEQLSQDYNWVSVAEAYGLTSHFKVTENGAHVAQGI